jgi:hypothetical protein
MFWVKSKGLFPSGSMLDGGNNLIRSAIVGVSASPTLYTRL